MQGTRPITDMLRDIRKGAMLDEISEAMREVVEGVRATGKVGELTLKLKIQPASSATTSTLLITDDVKTKVPSLDRGASIFFATKDNNLQRDDPDQPDMFPRAVDKDSPLRETESKSDAG